MQILLFSCILACLWIHGQALVQVSKVTGCFDITPSTAFCPTSGSRTLRVTGTGFPSDAIIQLRNGSDQAPVECNTTYVSETQLECRGYKELVTPGGRLDVQVISTANGTSGYRSGAAVYFSSVPTVTGVSGCVGSGLSTTLCPTATLPSDPLHKTIYVSGTNFRELGLFTIKFGSVACHSSIRLNDTYAKCTWYELTGTGHEVSVVVGEEVSASSGVTVSFYPKPSLSSVSNCVTIGSQPCSFPREPNTRPLILRGSNLAPSGGVGLPSVLITVSSKLSVQCTNVTVISNTEVHCVGYSSSRILGGSVASVRYTIYTESTTELVTMRYSSSCPTDSAGNLCSGKGFCDAGSDTCKCYCGDAFGFWQGIACHECQPGYYGALCKLECPGGNPVCSGHGSCYDGTTGNGTCTCEHGYSGADCGTLCPLVNNAVCGDRGTCFQSNNTCKCNTPELCPDCKWEGSDCSICGAGYYGSSCNVPCPGLNTTGITCSGQGTCNVTTDLSSAKCNCVEGFGTFDCSVACPRYAGSICGGHGACEQETGTCICHSSNATGFWNGTDCSYCANNYANSTKCDLLCPLNNNITCSGHGYCSGLGTCVCDSNSTHKWCGQLCDSPSCLTENQCPTTFNCRQKSCCGKGLLCISHPTLSVDTSWTGTDCQVPCPVLGGVVCTSSLQGTCNHGIEGKVVISNGTSSGVCICRPPWGGKFCQVDISCAECVANGGGTCLLDPVTDLPYCKCKSGYYGVNCKNQCLPNATMPCNSRGTCRDGVDGIGTCLCDLGYTGPSCQFKCPGSTIAPCSNNGICTVNAAGTDAICQCHADSVKGYWSGTTCSVCRSTLGDSWAAPFCNTSCLPAKNRCNGHGLCASLNGGTSVGCVCYDDAINGFWSGDTCSQCVNNSKLAYYGSKCTSPCPGLGTACGICNGKGACNSGIAGSGVCKCETGWTGIACDQCEDNYYGLDCASKCSGHSTNIICSGHGTCNDGITGDGACNCVTPSAENGAWTGTTCSQCYAGFYGPKCAQTCFGVSFSHIILLKSGQSIPTLCSGHGTCSSGPSGNGTCFCANTITRQYVGVNCEVSCPQATTYAFDNSLVCGGPLRGACTQIETPTAAVGECVCHNTSRWTGTACDECGPNLWGRECNETCTRLANCNNRGECILGRGDLSDGVGGCHCELGFTGLSCEQTCPGGGGSGPNCNGHGTCTASTAVGATQATCTCDESATAGHWDDATFCATCQLAYANSSNCDKRCPVGANGLFCSGHGYCSQGACVCEQDRSNRVFWCGPLGTCETSDASVCTVDLCTADNGQVTFGKYGSDCTNVCPGVTQTSLLGTSSEVVCSGRGLCGHGKNGKGGCTCRSANSTHGWGGSDCSLTCPGAVGATIHGNIGLVCSGYGVCSSDATCSCLPSRVGRACQSQCPGTVPCSGHGTCVANSTDHATCQCTFGWGDVDCSKACPTVSGIPCGGHGDCPQNMNGVCVCHHTASQGFWTKESGLDTESCRVCATKVDLSVVYPAGGQFLKINGTIAMPWPAGRLVNFTDGTTGAGTCRDFCGPDGSYSVTGRDCFCNSAVTKRYGSNCTLACPQLPNGTECSGHGTCSATGTGAAQKATCSCVTNWYGPACSVFCTPDKCVQDSIAAGTAYPSTYGNWQCAALTGACECLDGEAGHWTGIADSNPPPACGRRCKDGYWGPQCTQICPCSGHGACNKETGTVPCTCFNADDGRGHWAGLSCDVCAAGYAKPLCLSQDRGIRQLVASSSMKASPFSVAQASTQTNLGVVYQDAAANVVYIAGTRLMLLQTSDIQLAVDGSRSSVDLEIPGRFYDLSGRAITVIPTASSLIIGIITGTFGHRLYLEIFREDYRIFLVSHIKCRCYQYDLVTLSPVSCASFVANCQAFPSNVTSREAEIQIAESIFEGKLPPLPRTNMMRRADVVSNGMSRFAQAQATDFDPTSSSTIISHSLFDSTCCRFVTVYDPPFVAVSNALNPALATSPCSAANPAFLRANVTVQPQTNFSAYLKASPLSSLLTAISQALVIPLEDNVTTTTGQTISRSAYCANATAPRVDTKMITLLGGYLKLSSSTGISTYVARLILMESAVDVCCIGSAPQSVTYYDVNLGTACDNVCVDVKAMTLTPTDVILGVATEAVGSLTNYKGVNLVRVPLATFTDSTTIRAEVISQEARTATDTSVARISALEVDRLSNVGWIAFDFQDSSNSRMFKFFVETLVVFGTVTLPSLCSSSAEPSCALNGNIIQSITFMGIERAALVTITVGNSLSVTLFSMFSLSHAMPGIVACEHTGYIQVHGEGFANTTDLTCRYVPKANATACEADSTFEARCQSRSTTSRDACRCASAVFVNSSLILCPFVKSSTVDCEGDGIQVRMFNPPLTASSSVGWVPTSVSSATAPSVLVKCTSMPDSVSPISVRYDSTSVNNANKVILQGNNLIATKKSLTSSAKETWSHCMFRSIVDNSAYVQAVDMADLAAGSTALVCRLPPNMTRPLALPSFVHISVDGNYYSDGLLFGVTGYATQDKGSTQIIGQPGPATTWFLDNSTTSIQNFMASPYILFNAVLTSLSHRTTSSLTMIYDWAKAHVDLGVFLANAGGEALTRNAAEVGTSCLNMFESDAFERCTMFGVIQTVRVQWQVWQYNSLGAFDYAAVPRDVMFYRSLVMGMANDVAHSEFDALARYFCILQFSDPQCQALLALPSTTATARRRGASTSGRRGSTFGRDAFVLSEEEFGFHEHDIVRVATAAQTANHSQLLAAHQMVNISIPVAFFSSLDSSFITEFNVLGSVGSTITADSADANCDGRVSRDELMSLVDPSHHTLFSIMCASVLTDERWIANALRKQATPAGSSHISVGAGNVFVPDFDIAPLGSALVSSQQFFKLKARRVTPISSVFVTVSDEEFNPVDSTIISSFCVRSRYLNTGLSSAVPGLWLETPQVGYYYHHSVRPCSYQARHAAVSGTFPGGSDGALFVFGGLGSSVSIAAARLRSNFTSTEVLRDAWQYTVVGGWREVSIPGTIPSARFGAAYFQPVPHGVLYMYGGRAINGTYLRDFWILQSVNGVPGWHMLCSSCAPGGRAFASMATWGGSLYLFGGLTSAFGNSSSSTYLSDMFSTVLADCSANCDFFAACPSSGCIDRDMRPVQTLPGRAGAALFECPAGFLKATRLCLHGGNDATQVFNRVYTIVVSNGSAEATFSPFTDEYALGARTGHRIVTFPLGTMDVSNFSAIVSGGTVTPRDDLEISYNEVNGTGSLNVAAACSTVGCASIEHGAATTTFSFHGFVPSSSQKLFAVVGIERVVSLFDASVSHSVWCMSSAGMATRFAEDWSDYNRTAFLAGKSTFTPRKLSHILRVDGLNILRPDVTTTMASTTSFTSACLPRLGQRGINSVGQSTPFIIDLLATQAPSRWMGQLVLEIIAGDPAMIGYSASYRHYFLCYSVYTKSNTDACILGLAESVANADTNPAPNAETPTDQACVVVPCVANTAALCTEHYAPARGNYSAAPDGSAFKSELVIYVQDEVGNRITNDTVLAAVGADLMQVPKTCTEGTLTEIPGGNSTEISRRINLWKECSISHFGALRVGNALPASNGEIKFDPPSTGYHGVAYTLVLSARWPSSAANPRRLLPVTTNGVYDMISAVTQSCSPNYFRVRSHSLCCACPVRATCNGSEVVLPAETSSRSTSWRPSADSLDFLDCTNKPFKSACREQYGSRSMSISWLSRRWSYDPETGTSVPPSTLPFFASPAYDELANKSLYARPLWYTNATVLHVYDEDRGYWLSGPCAGNSSYTAVSENCSSCLPGYEGVGCSVCTKGYASPVASSRCEKCNAPLVTWIIIVLFIFGSCLLLLILVYSNLGNRANDHLSIIFRMLTNHLQVASKVGKFAQETMPSVLREVFGISDTGSSLSLGGIIAFNCALGAVPGYNFYMDFVFTKMLLPIYLLFIFAILYFFWHLFRSRKHKVSPDHRLTRIEASALKRALNALRLAEFSPYLDFSEKWTHLTRLRGAYDVCNALSLERVHTSVTAEEQEAMGMAPNEVELSSLIEEQQVIVSAEMAQRLELPGIEQEDLEVKQQVIWNDMTATDLANTEKLVLLATGRQPRRFTTMQVYAMTVIVVFFMMYPSLIEGCAKLLAKCIPVCGFEPNEAELAAWFSQRTALANSVSATAMERASAQGDLLHYEKYGRARGIDTTCNPTWLVTRRFQEEDVSVDCGTATYRLWYNIGVIMFIFYGIGIPVLAVLIVRILRWREDRMARASGKISLHDNLKVYSSDRMFVFLLQGYKRKWWFWESVVLMRKMLFVLVVVFISVPRLQMYTAMWTLAIFLNIHLVINPYEQTYLFRLEAYSLSTIIATLNLSLLYDWNDVIVDGSTGYWALTGFLMLINFLILPVFLYFISREFVSRLKRIRNNIEKFFLTTFPSLCGGKVDDESGVAAATFNGNDRDSKEGDEDEKNKTPESATGSEELAESADVAPESH